MGLIADFLRAAGQMLDRRFLGVLARALALTVALLAGFSAGAVWLVGFLPPTFDLWLVGEVDTPLAAIRAATLGALVIASAFLMFPVAAAFVGLFLDEIADAVEARHYPDLGKARGLTLWQEIRAGVTFAAFVLAVNAVAFVFYLLSGPLAPFVFWAVNGYLLGREYFEMVAARRIGPEGTRELRRRHGLRIWVAGTLMAVPLSVPVLNLVVPLAGVATFTHMFHRLWRRSGISAPKEG
jgi:uncharacterized protein involved in cysteine biosynthesis